MLDKFLIWLRGPAPSELALVEIETLKAERDALAARLKGKQQSPFVHIGEEFEGSFDYEQHDTGRHR
ncbi:MAG TPA: hypothetical protein VFA89_11455 [Terriglobales bacterium]|nr:hypothetical protein [Terriglobales bacterium]